MSADPAVSGTVKGNHVLTMLWIAPNLNDYKVDMLNALVRRGDVELCVLAGQPLHSAGHRYSGGECLFQRCDISVAKRWFGFHWRTHMAVARLLSTRRDIVLLPIEKKNLLLILALCLCRFFFRFRLVSYNHAFLRSRHRELTRIDRYLSRRMFSLYDQVVFYTEGALRAAERQQLIAPGRGAFANNTLDVESIRSKTEFSVNQSRSLTILFIGRLVNIKRPDLLRVYYELLQSQRSDVSLHIVGDGPESETVRSLAEDCHGVTWFGATTDEATIRERMKQAHVVFVPGDSGLSIVHAFSYGKPYITLDDKDSIHGPEIDYLQHGKNGLLLAGTLSENASEIAKLIDDREAYEKMCRAAYDTASSLGVERWANQMARTIQAITDGRSIVDA